MQKEAESIAVLNTWIKKKKGERFLDRSPKEFGEVFELYFSGKGYDREIFEKQWGKMGELLNLNPKLMLPSDRFDRELAPVKGFRVGDELEDLSEWINDQLRDKGLKRLPCELGTLGEVIDALNEPVES